MTVAPSTAVLECVMCPRFIMSCPSSWRCVKLYQYYTLICRAPSREIYYISILEIYTILGPLFLHLYHTSRYHDIRRFHLSRRSIPSVANHVLSEVGREYSTYQPLTLRIRYSRHRAARSRQRQVAAIEWIQRITNWSPTESGGPRIPKSSEGIKPRRILALW